MLVNERSTNIVRSVNTGRPLNSHDFPRNAGSLTLSCVIFFLCFFSFLAGPLEFLRDGEEWRGASWGAGTAARAAGNGGGGGGSGEGCGTESSFNMHGGRTAEDNHAASFRTRHIDKCCKGQGGRRLAGSGVRRRRHGALWRGCCSGGCCFLLFKLDIRS